MLDLYPAGGVALPLSLPLALALAIALALAAGFEKPKDLEDRKG